MVCPKCGSSNVIVQAVTDVKTKHRGCSGWMLWILLAICTVGLILIIPPNVAPHPRAWIEICQ